MYAERPTTYLTTRELKALAEAKFAEAAATQEGPRKQQVLRTAQRFQSLAEVKGWLNSELQPPK
jgi:hypothetical protein